MTPPPIHEAGSAPKRAIPVTWVVGGLAIGCCVICVPLGSSILIPVFAKARQDAQREGCLSRLRQQSVAFTLYSESNNDRFPPATVWMDAIGTKSGPSKKALLFGRREPRMLRCPAISGSGYGYAMNLNLSGKKKSAIGDLANAPLTFDSVQRKRNAVAADPDAPSPARHGEMNCFLFADGHSMLIRAGAHPWRK